MAKVKEMRKYVAKKKLSKGNNLPSFIGGIIVGFIIYLMLAPLVIVALGRGNVYSKVEDAKEHTVGIVLGAAVSPEGQPREMLRDRLDTAIQLYNQGKITKILVSGDNREENYDEPAAMYNYLVFDNKVPAEDVVKDFAGRRTYDTCARAKEIFEVEEAIVISQGYHLPRTMYLCSNFGIATKGVSATLNDSYEGEWYFKAREFFAIHKALWDVNIVTPNYVGGDKIDLLWLDDSRVIDPTLIEEVSD